MPVSFSTPQTLSFTASAADANRLQAVATGLGFPSIKAMIVALVTQQASAFEQSANQQTYATAYTPIVPS
jgi:hypothetical protein